MLTIALAGDTMLGRNVGALLTERPGTPLFDDEIRDAAAGADLFLANLECCMSERGERWPDPAKPFFFRAPPSAVGLLDDLGVDVVTLANNHALDYGEPALHDTLAHLDAAGIRAVGAGADVDAARRPAVVEVRGMRIGVVAGSDHPADFAADAHRTGIAWWDHRHDDWLTQAVAALAETVHLVVATVHWGPNMVTAPGPDLRAAAQRLVDAGADVVAGHSAHVFHGVRWADHDGRAVPVLYDLGDFVDDYAVDPRLRNDLGLLWFVRWDAGRMAVQALPLYLDTCRTRVATGDDRRWIVRRLGAACAEFGTTVVDRGDLLSVSRS